MFLIVCLLFSQAASAQLPGFPPAAFDNRAALVGASAPPSVVVTAINNASDFAASIASGSASNATIADAPVGSLIVAWVGNTSQFINTILSCVDSAGDTLTQAVNEGGSPGYYNVSLWYVVAAHDLPIGGTFTCTTTFGNYIIFAVDVTGLGGALDTTNTGTGNTSLSIATGTLAAPSEIVFGAQYPSNSVGSYTTGAGFTSFDPTQAAAGDGELAYEIVSATTSVTYAPSWSSSINATGAVASFK